MAQQPFATRPGEDGRHLTYCRLCEATCGLVATVDQGIVTKVEPDRRNVHSHGHVCVKGLAIRTITYDEDRILYPLRRVGPPGAFERVSWAEALIEIADRLKAILAEHGPNALAGYFGNPLSFASLGIMNFMTFLYACGSRKVFCPAAQDTTSRSMASVVTFGNPFHFPIPDLARSDFMFIFGANPLVSMGSLFCTGSVRGDLDAIAGRGRVIVFDPRRTETARTYEHVAVRPDTDIWLLGAMLRHLIEQGRADHAFLAEHVTGYDAFSQAVCRIDYDVAAARCGVPVEQIRALASAFAAAEHPVAYGRLGICRSSFASLTNILVDALNIICGRFGQPGGWGFGLELNKAIAEGNAYGPATVGANPSRIGNVPDVGGQLPSGLLAADIDEPGDGRIRALFVAAGNPVRSVPGSDRLEQALESLDLMVATDLYISETSRYAHYILPATGFLERSDTNIERVGSFLRPTVLATRAVIPPVGEARSEYEIFAELARLMGVETGFSMTLPEEAAACGIGSSRDFHLDNAVRHSAIGGADGAFAMGMTLNRLLDEHPHGLAMDGHDMLADSLSKIAHADRKLHLWDPLVAGEFERLLAGGDRAEPSFRLIGRRDLRSMNSWMHNDDRLVRSQHPALLMHPSDAAGLGVTTGMTVTLSTKAGALDVEIEVSDDMMPGVVSYPHGWQHRGGWQRANAAGGVNINSIIPSEVSDLETVSGMNFMDGVPVSIAAAPPAASMQSRYETMLS